MLVAFAVAEVLRVKWMEISVTFTNTPEGAKKCVDTRLARSARVSPERSSRGDTYRRGGVG